MPLPRGPQGRCALLADWEKARSGAHLSDGAAGRALRAINFSKVSKIDQRRDREGSMVVRSPASLGIYR
jgi:hypothetical protein